MRQMKFEGVKFNPQYFGGSDLKGKRKERRPLSTKKPLHLVIKSEQINKPISFVKHYNIISKLVSSTARRFGIKIMGCSINFNHCHLVIQFANRAQYVSFIRVLNSLIVSKLESKTGLSLKGLFTLRPFTRVIEWGKDLTRLKIYVQRNTLESEGYYYRDCLSS